MRTMFIVFAIMMLAFSLVIPTQPVTAAAQADGVISGKVVETMDSGGYTYMLLEKNKKKTWVAVPQMKVEKGKNMSVQPGSEMNNFKSKTMNRTFDLIIFSPGPVPAK